MVLLELIGVALGAAAISGLANASDEKSKQKRNNSFEGNSNVNIKKCPNCGITLNKKAKHCRNCNYNFRKGRVVFRKKQHTNTSKSIEQKKYVDSELYAELINGKNIPNMPTVQDIHRTYIENPSTESKSNKKCSDGCTLAIYPRIAQYFCL